MTRFFNPLAPRINARVTEPMIRELVHCTGAKVRKDDVLRLIFNDPNSDLGAHINKLCSFWSSIMLISGRNMVCPIQGYTTLPKNLAALFNNWLSLLSKTAERICLPHAAALVTDCSQHIAHSLGSGFPLQRGEMVGTGEIACKQGM